MTAPFLGTQPHEGRTALLAGKGIYGPAAAAILEAAGVSCCVPPTGFCAVASADTLQSMVRSLVARLPGLELQGMERQLEALIALLEAYIERPILCSQLYFTNHCRNNCAVNVAGGLHWGKKRSAERDRLLASVCETLHLDVVVFPQLALKLVLETSEPTTRDSAIFYLTTLCAIPGLAEQLLEFATAVAIKLAFEDGIYNELQVQPGDVVKTTSQALDIPRVRLGGAVQEWSTFVRSLHEELEKQTKLRYALG